jgi:hypothetical protein
MNIPGPPVVLNPEVIHLAKLVKIELDELQRRTMKLEARGNRFHARLDKLESQPTGGPPTPDLAAQPDSNKKDADSLGLSVPPGSESALREGYYWVWYQDNWRIAEWNGEDWDIFGWGVTCPRSYAKVGPRIIDPPPSGPPTPDLAAQPDSNTEERIPDPTNAYECAKASIDRLEKLRIGVYDYNSLVACLRSNFEQLFPETYRLAVRDPQDMIQLMTETVQNLRRQLEKNNA